MYPKHKTNLSINFCGVKFANPFILAAAPPTDDIEMVKDAFRAGWAGAILKTTSVEGTKVDLAYPMISGIDFENNRLMGMGNIDLISEHHIDVIEQRILQLKKEFPNNRVIASISGSDKTSWQEVARRTCKAGADLIECSFSCPQGTLGLKPGAMLGQDPVASASVTSWIKEVAGPIPIIIKLTPQVNDIAEIAMAVKCAGADAVCVGNTIPSLMGIDLESGVPFPNVGGKSTYSGLSGSAVKPVSLRCIAIVKKATDLAIAGSGGAISWKDAYEFMLVGAGLVEFCTAVMHYGVDIIEDLVEGFAFHLNKKGIINVSDIIGKSLEFIVSHEELPRKDWRPYIITDDCVRCGMCMVACKDGGHRAISMSEDRLPKIDDEKCVGCALCSSVCHVKCIEMQERNKHE